MRIIAGKSKGIRLVSPKGNDVRPVQDKVKGSFFSILYDVSNKNILDIFAGSGSVGLEALSRDAQFAVFIEYSKTTVNVLRENIKKCHFENCSRVLSMSYEKAIKILSKENYKADIVFLDPPYYKNLVSKTLELLEKSGIVDQNSIVVAEHSSKDVIEASDAWFLTDKREYGQTIISFFKLK